MPLSDELLETARKRLGEPASRTETDLRRAISDLYYALFHALCETLAGLVAADSDRAASKEAWLSLYRLPDHEHVAKRCRDGRIREFPESLQRFANHFVAFKAKREDADYDVSKQFLHSQVANDIGIVETILHDFNKVDTKHRRNFAVFVSVKSRKQA